MRTHPLTDLEFTESGDEIHILIQSSPELPTLLKNTFNQLTSNKDIVLDYSTERNHYLDRVDSSKDIFTHILDVAEFCNIDPGRITFLSGNYLIAETYEDYCKQYNRKKFKQVAHKEFWLQQTVSTHLDISDNYNGKEKPYYFTCLNGIARPQRIQTCEHMIETGLYKKGICTFMFDNNDKNYLMQKGKQNIANMLPIEIKPNRDASGFHQCHAPQHPDFYQVFYDSYFDVITETSAGFYVPFSWWKDLFFTEKLWRSILYKRPFLLIGDYKALEKLKELGFRTFDNILFDESYDNIKDPEMRTQAVLDQVSNICSNLTIKQLHELINTPNVKSVVENNYFLINKLAHS